MGVGNSVRAPCTWRSAATFVRCIRRAAAPAGLVPVGLATAVALLSALPALAQVTSGGDGGHLGTNGGASSATSDGANGGVPSSAIVGGGGGGAGVNGGAGATDSSGMIAGGAAGVGAGQQGSGGQNGGGSSGGGGGGGAHGDVVTVDTTNAATITGGHGGHGGTSAGSNRSGGGGGAGGYGVVVDGSGLTYTNNGTIGGGGGGAGGAELSDGYGGNGGDGGYGVYLTGPGTLNNTGTIIGGAGGAGAVSDSGRGGDGGNGGAGVYFSGAATLINSGTITGGDAGAYGTVSHGSPTNGNEGQAGAGVVGADLTIINSGTIAGGAYADGSHANAITFTGGVNSLTLQAGSTITGNVVAFSSADTLALGGSTNATFDLSKIDAAAQYQGFGVFKKTGSSTWTLTGIGTTTTNWTIDGGTLEVGDSSSPSTTLMGDVTVNAGGTLAGHGTVTGDVTNTAGGTVAPGGSIGTLTVSGNYAQGSNSTLLIEVSPSAASKLSVSGTASLAGTVKFVYEPGVYSATTYNILSAASVTGTFSTISGTAPSGFSQSLTYSATDVDLVLGTMVVAPTNDTVFTATGTSVLLNGQQTNASLLDHLSGLRDGSASDIFQTAFASFGDTGVASALAYSGPDAMNDNPLASLPQRMARIGGWFRGVGSFANLSGTAAAPGFNTRGGGFLAGVDRPVAPNLTAGIAGGYTRTNLSENGGSTGSIDSTRFALYGSYGFGAWALDASLGYAYNRFSNSRFIASVGEVASSSHDGHEFDGALQAGRRFAIGGLSVAPAVGLQYVRLYERGFDEAGAPGFNLSVSSRKSDSVRPFIGARAVKPWLTASGVRMTLAADVSYSRELSGTPPSLVQVGGGSFTVDGLSPSRDQVALGTGISARMNDSLSFFADYHATLPTGNLTQHSIKAGLVYAF